MPPRAPFLGNLPPTINPQSPLAGETFDRRIDTLPKAQAASSPGAASGPFPFDISFGPGSDASHSEAFIRPGTINGLVPSNILTTYDLENSTTYFLVLSVTVADGAITGATLSMPTSAPSPIPATLGEPPLTFDYVLGLVIAAEWFRTIGDGSLFASAVEAFRVDKTSPAPGTLPYEIWYSWALETA